MTGPVKRSVYAIHVRVSFGRKPSELGHSVGYNGPNGAGLLVEHCAIGIVSIFDSILSLSAEVSTETSKPVQINCNLVIQ